MTSSSDKSKVGSISTQAPSQRGFHLSIRHRLTLLFTGLVAINFMAVGVGWLALTQLVFNNPLSTKVGSQRGTTFKLAYLANIRQDQVNSRNRVSVTREIEAEIAQFEEFLRGLRGGSAKLGLRPITDPTVLVQLEKVEATWRLYREQLQDYLVADAAKENQHLKAINNLAGFLANQLDTMANSVDKEIADNAGKSQSLLLVTVLLSMLAIAISFLIVSRISRSLTQVTQAAKIMGSGNFTVRSTVATADEIGMLSSTLNTMAEQISSLLQGLEARGRQLEDYSTSLAISMRQGQETLAHLSAIIDNLADGLLVTNTSGQIDRFNPALLAMFGKGEMDLTGKDADELSSNEVTELVQQTRKHPKEVFTAEILLASGRVGGALATAIFKNSSSQDVDQCIGSVILIRDITAEKEIDRMKTDFISTVSHELRTPLTSVLGFAKIIKKKLEDGVFPLLQVEDRKTQKTVRQVGENINIIISEGERLTSLINDVLDIAKMEAGKVDWQMQPIAVSEIIERAIAATSALFEQNGLTLTEDVEPGLPDAIGDRDRLIQVLINLISNAVKFTEKGSCTLRARRQGNEMSVSVIDTGIGIAPSDLEKVFEKFKQVGDTLTDKPKGTGLGLPICKQIVEHHGGRMSVESQLGIGSTFSFTLPLSRDIMNRVFTGIGIEKLNIDTLFRHLKESIVQAAPSLTEHHKNILVVDDDANIRQLLRQELETEGYEVREATDGMDALTQIKTTIPDLIILDVMMPQISGFDVAAVLKNNPATMNIPIIILSIIEDKERGYRLGIDRYFTKPLNTESLLREIGLLISQGTSKKKVLVVDEDISTVKILASVLQAKGYSVVEASNGPECIEKALSIKPDMIIVDSGFSQQHNLVKTLRFENGLENVLFLLLGDHQADSSDNCESKSKL